MKQQFINDLLYQPHYFCLFMQLGTKQLLNQHSIQASSPNNDPEVVSVSVYRDCKQLPVWGGRSTDQVTSEFKWLPMSYRIILNLLSMFMKHVILLTSLLTHQTPVLPSSHMEPVLFLLPQMPFSLLPHFLQILRQAFLTDSQVQFRNCAKIRN